MALNPNLLRAMMMGMASPNAIDPKPDVRLTELLELLDSKDIKYTLEGGKLNILAPRDELNADPEIVKLIGRVPMNHNDPAIAAKLQEERKKRKAENYAKRNKK